jgi:hypothetical protein
VVERTGDGVLVKTGAGEHTIPTKAAEQMFVTV